MHPWYTHNGVKLGDVYGGFTVTALTRPGMPIRKVEVTCTHGTSQIASADLARGRNLGCRKCAADKNRKYLTETERLLAGRVGLIIQRCNNPKASGYHNYGAIGIRVWGPWETNRPMMVSYLMALPGFDLALDIDRIDNSKGYAPGNLRWVSKKDNARNKRTNIVIVFNGESMILDDFARLHTRISAVMVKRYLDRQWSPEKIAAHIPRR